MFSPYILFTALTAQFFYILVNWYFFRRKEYVIYSMYVLILAIYFLNRYMTDENGMHHLGSVQFSKLYPDKILCVLSYIFYFKFGRRFVEAKTRYPSIDRLMIFTEKCLFAYIGIEVIILLTTGYSTLENILFLPVNASIFIVLIFVFKAIIKKNEMLDRFILTGSMFYGISALITLWQGIGKPPLYDDHFFFLQIGALVEMVFLNAGLVYKSRKLQNQTLRSQKQLIERYEENQELLMRLGTIRERISRDLHDDIGASLSSIKAYSEILKENPKNLAITDLIIGNSSEMIDSLELIAWTINPAHDHFRSLKNMMRKFAVPLCHAKQIEFEIESNAVDDDMPLPGEIRQQVFLIFKESMNNMIKYASASRCVVNMQIKKDHFIVVISDNGKGFEGNIKGSGNGLLNMQRRAREIHGELRINSNSHSGTNIHLQLPYPFRIPNLWDMKER